jgi:ketosteroid isomerase-like protein
VSQESIGVVLRYFEATNRGDFPSAMAAYADDVVLVIDEDAIPTNAGTFTGREAVGQWFGDWFRSFARGYRFSVEEMQSVGDRVVLVAHHHAHGRSSGLALDWSAGLTFTIRADKITRLEIYRGLDEALEAAGIEE